MQNCSITAYEPVDIKLNFVFILANRWIDEYFDCVI